DIANLRNRYIHPLRDFLACRFASEFLNECARSADQLVDRFDHVYRNADRTRLVCDGTCNGLPDPPRCVCRELVTAAVFELVHGLHETDVAFLDQIEELEYAVRVFLRD